MFGGKTVSSWMTDEENILWFTLGFTTYAQKMTRIPNSEKKRKYNYTQTKTTKDAYKRH